MNKIIYINYLLFYFIFYFKYSPPTSTINIHNRNLHMVAHALENMNTIEIQECMYSIHPSLKNNVYAANRLPIHVEAPAFLVSNLDPDTQPGSHWVAIHIDEHSVGQYFDSFGRPPAGLHKVFLRRNCRVWNYNTKRIQDDWTSVCGEYCLVYLYYKFHGISMLDFTNTFIEKETIVNDILLHELFKKHFH